MTTTRALPPTIARLVAETNAHDIDGLVGCFAPDYTLVMPNHPARDFVGTEQVRRNWTQLFAGIPDIRVSVTAAAHAAEDPAVWWTEWEMRGTRPDGGTHLMRGVMIFTVGASEADLIRANRFYVEPVDAADDDDNDALIARLTEAGRP